MYIIPLDHASDILLIPVSHACANIGILINAGIV